MVRVLLEVSKNSGVSLHSRYADQCAMPNHSWGSDTSLPQRQADWGDSLRDVCDCSTCYARFQRQDKQATLAPCAVALRVALTDL
jgi:hypothetical protein